MDYKILRHNDAYSLEEEVISYLKEGYILAGGHQVTTVKYNDYTNANNALREISPRRWEYSQTVFRPDKITKEKVII